MTLETLTRTKAWREFETYAARRKADPVKLLAELIEEHLQTAEVAELDRTISREVQRSGLTEDDAVDVVRAYRAEKKRRAAS